MPNLPEVNTSIVICRAVTIYRYYRISYRLGPKNGTDTTFIIRDTLLTIPWLKKHIIGDVMFLSVTNHESEITT